MIGLDRLRVLHAVATHGSLSTAARTLTAVVPAGPARPPAAAALLAALRAAARP